MHSGRFSKELLISRNVAQFMPPVVLSRFTFLHPTILDFEKYPLSQLNSSSDKLVVKCVAHFTGNYTLLLPRIKLQIPHAGFNSMSFRCGDYAYCRDIILTRPNHGAWTQVWSHIEYSNNASQLPIRVQMFYEAFPRSSKQLPTWLLWVVFDSP